MRVLHVISGIDLRHGGTTTAVLGLAAAQQGVGLNVTLLANRSAANDQQSAEALRASGVRVELIDPVRGPIGWSRRLSATVDALVSANDVTHVHALWEEVQHRACRAASRAGTPYVISPHGMLDPWSLSQKRLKKRLYLAWRLRANFDCAAAIHFTSEVERDLCAPMRLRAPAIVEPIGLDLSEFAAMPPPGSFRARHSKIGDRPLLLFMGRLHPKKGLDLLIPAFSSLTREAKAGTRASEAVLVIAGPDDDGYAAVVESMVAGHGVADRVVFTGMLLGRERIAALGDADLFVLPSRQENFGIVVAEALAAGTPVVISDQVNIHPEIGRAGVGGVVPLAADALAAELASWLAGAGKDKVVSDRARAFAARQYDWLEIARRWVGRYEEIARRPTGAAARHPA